ncbi:MAG: prepilin-type N-terminal cleavage/methylation domain-containing protein [Tepidisphaerales bacterium]
MTRRRHRHGFTLLSLLIALVLLGVFALVAGEVFNNTMRAVRTSADIHNQLNSFEGLLARLREDAWAARSVQVENPQTAVLVDSAAQKIVWSIAGTGEFTRTAGADVCRWNKFDVPLVFAAHPSGLLLQQGTRADESIILQSQFLAMERSRP